MVENIALAPIAPSALGVDYRLLTTDHRLGSDVLAAVTFGLDDPPRGGDPRCLRIPLAPITGRGLAQVWTSERPVSLGQTGAIRHADDGAHLMGSLEVDEEAHGGLAQAAETAYRWLLSFHAASRYRYVWRVWNFISDINDGAGDGERYKQFCLGRARAFAEAHDRATCIGYPAATAVGTRDGRRRVRICWLAGAEAGSPLENPRQVRAYRYPRQYGPACPSFSRAMLAPDGTLLVSGTASIVGHGSMHPDDPEAQLEETLRNIDAVLDAAKEHGVRSTGEGALLTVFLRRPVEAGPIEARLRRSFPGAAGLVILDADICRAELLLEIEVIVPRA